LTDLADLGERSTALAQAAANLDAIADIDESPGRCRQLISDFAGVAADVKRLSQTYAALARAVGTRALTNTEQRLLDTLNPSGTEATASIEVGCLLQEWHDEQAPDVWTLLQALYQKRRVRILVEPIHHA
jgi:hypothetical protein